MRREKVYRVTVDYSKTVEQLRKTGHFTCSTYWSDEKFPIKATAKIKDVEFIVLHLGYHASLTRVRAEIRRRGLRPVTNQELMSFGGEFPDLQKEYSIVQVGSICFPISYVNWLRDVSQLSVWEGKRTLDAIPLIRGEVFWGCMRFLVVRKKARKLTVEKE